MRNCPICSGKRTIFAYEVPEIGGWVIPEGLNGEARCNRPRSVWFETVPGVGRTRVGRADCPLCARRKIEKTETDDFGYPLMEGIE